MSLSHILQGGHTHWCWRSRYNPFHDQLVLVSSNLPLWLSSLFHYAYYLLTCMAQSSGSDTQVILWRADTLSSVAAGSASSDPVATQPSSAAADAQICVYDEHEDSVYSVVRLSPKSWL